MITISSNYEGRLNGNNYVIGSSISSPFTPVINIYNLHHITPDECIYHKPELNISGVTGRTFKMNDMLSNLSSYLGLNCYKIGVNEDGSSIRIKVGKGYIADSEDKILLILSANTPKFNKFQQTDYSRYVLKPLTEENTKNLCLFVSTAFIKEKKYSLLYKKLEKDYISDAQMNNIEVRFISSEQIEKLNYSNEFKLNFNNIEQLQNHLNEEVGKLFYIRDSEFHNINPGLNISFNERNDMYIPPVRVAENRMDSLIKEFDEIFGTTERVVRMIDDTIVTELNTSSGDNMVITHEVVTSIDTHLPF